MLTLQIITGNEIFQDGGRHREVARILSDLANRLESGQVATDWRGDCQGPLYDINGNNVGSFTLS
jgi:hypothetical protein